MAGRFQRGIFALLPWAIASVCATVALDGLAVRAHVPPPWEAKPPTQGDSDVGTPPPPDPDAPSPRRSPADLGGIVNTMEVVPT